MNKNPKRSQTTPNIYRLIKEFFRISKISISPVPGKKLALNWLRLHLSNRKSAEPFAGKVGDFTLWAANHYDFLELFDEVFLVNAYYVKLEESVPIILDCGANCGFVTAYFKMFYPNAKITAFEPNPKIFSLLKKNIEINGWKDVLLINAACGAEKREIEFFIDESYSLSGSALSTAHDNKIKVKQVSMADFINEDISILKMDIEGAETEVIKNLAQTGKIRLVKRFAIEYHHRLFDSTSKLSDFLKVFEENGFDYNLFAFRNISDFYSTRWQSMMIYAFQK